ncbi:hypothetical protein [Pseudomonas brenneri]
MKFSYRITKHGTPDNGEWTSFHDVGKSVSEEEYLATEADYVNTVITVARCLGASSLTVSSLEMNAEGEFYVEGQEIEVDRLAPIVVAILRERIWCKLKSPVCEFHFGYDYYMYLVSAVAAEVCFPKTEGRLYFELFQSPYLDI